MDVEPVVGDDSQINLKSIPTLTGIIADIVNEEINDLCYPKKLKMNVPVTLETIKLDKDGKVI